MNQTENATTASLNIVDFPKHPNLDNEEKEQIGQKVHLVVGGCILLFGTFGNVMTLMILRTKQLRKLSTCIYMSVMAVCDLGKFHFMFLFGLSKLHFKCAATSLVKFK